MATETAETVTTEKESEDKVEESKNPLEMSDEEFLKTSPPDSKSDSKKVDDKPGDDNQADEKEKTEPDEKAQDDDTKADTKATDDKPKEPDKEKEAKSDLSGSKVTTDEPTDKKPKAAEAVDYEGFFKQIMTPFKANGKTFEVKTPEEAIRLMQKGAGYGRKLQDMQPHLKVLRMLEKNNLLDEGRLSFLIDLNQKKPDAIKKLIKDGGIDPLDLNTDDKVSYTPTNHAVTDQEVTFHQAVAEIQAQSGGNETLRLINQWDSESKALLWDSPEIFEVIQTQRDNGVYHQIVTEIDRQKLLGTIENSTPFLQAYKIAGDHLVKTNGFKPIQTRSGTTNGSGTQQPQVIATRTAVPKSQAQNSDKAAAAAPTKAVAANKPNLTVNPLEMADDDFMKQFKGRF